MAIISRVEFDKAQYHPGEKVQIDILFATNKEVDYYDCVLDIVIKDLDQLIWQKEIPFCGEKSIQVSWEVPGEIKQAGFSVNLVLKEDEIIKDTYVSCFDVVERWSLAPRYGFLATFNPDKGDKEIEEKIKKMKEYHLNFVQFYDWMYRHHQLLPETEEFKDIFERPLSLNRVRKQIKECRKNGILPIAYGAVYGAEKDFVAQHPDWIAATRNSQGRNSLLDEHPEYIQIMNIAEDCPWREHIVKEYKKAMEELGFAGIHLDQYGFPKTYYSIVDGKEEVKDMGEELGSFITYARKQLGKDAALIFNAVNNWPIEIVATCPQDLVYIEVWPPHDTFDHLRRLILRARELSGFKKQVVLAAYIAPLNKKKNIPQEAGERAARLTAAAIFASGGFHLVMGEGTAMLTDPYYPEYRELSPEFSRVMKDYYATITCYSKYLFALDLKDKSEYLTGGINGELKLKTAGEVIAIGPDARKNTIWTTVRENKDFKILNLVNLMGIDTVKWDEPQYTDPKYLQDLEVDWLIDENIEAIYWITPDGGDIRPQKIDFKRIKHDRGELVRFKVPELRYWGFVILMVG